MCAKVEQLEKPPDRRRYEKQSKIAARASSEERRTRSPPYQPVDCETVPQPEREESPMSTRTRERPIENPENED